MGSWAIRPRLLENDVGYRFSTTQPCLQKSQTTSSALVPTIEKETMTPSEIGGRLMMLATQLEAEERTMSAIACSQAAALIMFSLPQQTSTHWDSHEGKDE